MGRKESRTEASRAVPDFLKRATQHFSNVTRPKQVDGTIDARVDICGTSVEQEMTHCSFVVSSPGRILERTNTTLR